MRQLWIFLVLVTMVLIPFAFWGDVWTDRFTFSGSVAWLARFGQWAWLGGMVLLMGDLFLPVPGTLVMSAMGFIYGPILGSMLSILGSFCAGSVGYWMCRILGDRWAIRILGEKGFTQGQRTFNRVGGWLVVLSRWLPVFPEVISCMAGLNRMSAQRFHLALLASAVPMGIIYATIGHAGVAHPYLAIMLSALLPPGIWLVLSPIFNKMKN